MVASVNHACISRLTFQMRPRAAVISIAETSGRRLHLEVSQHLRTIPTGLFLEGPVGPLRSQRILGNLDEFYNGPQRSSGHPNGVGSAGSGFVPTGYLPTSTDQCKFLRSHRRLRMLEVSALPKLNEIVRLQRLVQLAGRCGIDTLTREAFDEILQCEAVQKHTAPSASTDCRILFVVRETDQCPERHVEEYSPNRQNSLAVHCPQKWQLARYLELLKQRLVVRFVWHFNLISSG